MLQNHNCESMTIFLSKDKYYSLVDVKLYRYGKTFGYYNSFHSMDTLTTFINEALSYTKQAGLDLVINLKPVYINMEITNKEISDIQAIINWSTLVNIPVSLDLTYIRLHNQRNKDLQNLNTLKIFQNVEVKINFSTLYFPIDSSDSKYNYTQSEDLIGYKVVLLYSHEIVLANKLCIISLRIPAGTPVAKNPQSRKCRAAKAYITDIYEYPNDVLANPDYYNCSLVSCRIYEFIYMENLNFISKKSLQKSKEAQGLPILITPIGKFDMNYHIECSSGIHFFEDIENARKYSIV